MKKILYAVSTAIAMTIVYLLSGFIGNNTSADLVPETHVVKPFSPTQYANGPQQGTKRNNDSPEEASRRTEISSIENKYTKEYKTKVRNYYLNKPKYTYKNKKFVFKDYYQIDKKKSTKFKIALWITKYKPSANGKHKKISEKTQYGKLLHAKKNIYYVKFKSKIPIIGQNIKVKKKGKSFYAYNKNKKIKKIKYLYRITTYIETNPFLVQ